MKQKSELKKCTHCQQQFGHGFALINHMRYCVVVSSAVASLGLAANQSSSKGKEEHSQPPAQHENEHHESSTQDDEVHLQSSTQDQGKDQGQDLGKEQGLQHTQQPIMRRKLVRKLTPQLKAIVEFLETV
jgi:hypothetical protein